MKAVRIVVLAVAAVSAIGLALVVRIALTGKPTSQAVAHAAVKPKPMARILVASRDLKVGERLNDADLDWKTWPVDEVQADWTREDAVPPVASAAPVSGAAPASASASSAVPATSVSAPGTTKQVDANGGVLSPAGVVKALLGGPKQPFMGAVVRLSIQAGEPITQRKIVRAGESGYLAVLLGPGKRAASIPVTVDTGAGGFVLPGDRVDVILTRKLETGKPNALFVSKTILRNMKVLAIDQTTQTDKDAAAVIGATATLEVASDEAETLAAAKAAGNLSLALRSYADGRAGTGRNGARALTSFGGEAAGGADSARNEVKVFRYGQASEDQASE
jgi:pilus assembly protein CpaB